MKVGDIVAKANDLHNLENRSHGCDLGIVVKIGDWSNPKKDCPDTESDFQSAWINDMGRRIDVLWPDNSTKSFAESSLRVVNEDR